MDSFQLDNRLEKDCYVLGKLHSSYLLLLNNVNVPWFILVPQTTEIEFHKLENSMQLKLIEQIKLVSNFIESQFEVTKINTATIGNIVRQMHIHIVGRHESDPYWPGVVWGQPSEPYSLDQAETIAQKTKDSIETLKAFKINAKH